MSNDTKFRVGQVWKDRSGEHWTVVGIDDSTTTIYPLTCVRKSDGVNLNRTAVGQMWESRGEHLCDLVELVSPYPKKVLNFWEARAAVFEGKTVQYTIDGFTYKFTPEEFSKASWSSQELGYEWQLVEEPKTFTQYVNVYPANGYDWVAHTQKLYANDRARKGRIGCIAITIDENGRLIEAKNI